MKEVSLVRVRKGFEGELCDDIDECLSEELKCDLNGTCYNTVGSFDCRCNEGFFGTGDKCEVGQCSDDVCPANQECLSDNTIDCGCKKGFFLNSNEDCVDLDECSTVNSCDYNSECENTFGSYSCVCDPGFHGNGTTCLRGNCRVESCPENEQCVSDNTFECECMSGFSRNGSALCIDDNECLTGVAKCDENADCININGSFVCICRRGFFGNGNYCMRGQCVDTICEANERCTSPVTVSCECKEGFTRDVSGSCTDFDECTAGLCPNNSNCTNKPGGFQCECLLGYSGMNCDDVDECQSEVCDVNATCSNTAGSFKCNCYTGLKQYNQTLCVDVDECSLKDHNCQTEFQYCQNSFRSYECKESLPFYFLSERLCMQADKRKNNFLYSAQKSLQIL